MNTDPRNKIGKQILSWCKANKMTYGYACATKKSRKPGGILWLSNNAMRVLLKNEFHSAP